MKSRLIYITLISFALCLGGCKKTNNTAYIKESGTRFHTTYHLTYQHERALTAEIDSVFDSFNAILNPFDSTSLVAKFNRNETDELHPMLDDVISKAIEVSEQTNGLYDITGAPLFDLWGFGTKKGVTRTASQEEIDSTLNYVGYKKLIVDREHKRLKKEDDRLSLNPSSLSKGYITDLVAKELERHGVTNYLVEIGGEIVANGVNPKGECWKIGINKPIPDSTSMVNDIIFAISLCDKVGVASSGDYRNFKVVDGKKVAHTINVLTGYPAHQDILSATVIAPTSMEADAWATAFMAMGLEASKKILDKQPQLSVCLIYSDPETGEYKTYEKGIQIIELEKE